MAFETITVTAAGREYTGWKSISIRAALNEAARSFEIEVSEISADQLAEWRFPPGTAVEIKATGSLLLSGYVDDYEPSLEAGQHGVKISGRSKSADLADSSVDHPTCQLEQKTLVQIANELGGSYAEIKADIEVDTGEKIEVFRTGKGTSIHSQILRIAQQRKAVMKGNADGSVQLTRAGKSRHTGSIAEGLNCKKISAKLSMKERFSSYQVVGQSADNWDDTQFQPKGSATDSAVPRKRVKVIVDGAETNPGLARDRAEWERDRAAGISLTATVTVATYRDDKKQIWEPGWLIFVKSRTARVEQDMLIESVEFKQDDISGTEATLGLVDPRAYAGKPAQASGSDEMWDIDE